MTDAVKTRRPVYFPCEAVNDYTHEHVWGIGRLIGVFRAACAEGRALDDAERCWLHNNRQQLTESGAWARKKLRDWSHDRAAQVLAGDGATNEAALDAAVRAIAGMEDFTGATALFWDPDLLDEEKFIAAVQEWIDRSAPGCVRIPPSLSPQTFSS